MQVAEVILARTVWLLNVKLLNAAGLAWGPILSSFKDRYKFLRYPTTPAEFDLTKGVQYGGGEFMFNGKQVGVGITMHSDGLVADSLVSTETSDAFLEDLAGWITGNFGFRPAQDITTRVIYDSQLEFKSDIDLTKSFDKITAFSAILREFSGNPTEESSGFIFACDPGLPNPTFPTFTFERRAGAKFLEKKYFSKAILPTRKHIQILEQFERMFS